MRTMAVLMGLVMALVGLVGAAQASDTSAPCQEGLASAECGWFWGFIQQLEEPDEDETPEEPAPIPIPELGKAEEPAEALCVDADSWEPGCGFVDPDGDFAFQAMQRDALLEQAVMHPNDPERVEGFQRYMRWAVSQAVVMSRMWEWNMLQDQELNPFAHSPVSAFGLRAATRARNDQRAEIMDEINRQGGFLVWFTRSECPYCHDMLPAIRELEKRTGLTVWNASLDAHCMEGFDQFCRSGDAVLEGARHLGIEAVPDLWIHLPADDLWFRVSSGVEAATRIIARIDLFFGGVQRAAERGLQAASDGSAPPVDFDVPDLLDRARGGLGAIEDTTP